MTETSKFMLRLKAAPGRVILRFPDYPEEEIKNESGLFIPSTSVQIPEMAEVVDVGEPLNEEERVYARFFLDCKVRGILVLADYGDGSRYWRPNYDAKKWGFLKPIRSYRLSSPSACLEKVEDVAV